MQDTPSTLGSCNTFHSLVLVTMNRHGTIHFCRPILCSEVDKGTSRICAIERHMLKFLVLSVCQPAVMCVHVMVSLDRCTLRTPTCSIAKIWPMAVHECRLSFPTETIFLAMQQHRLSAAYPHVLCNSSAQSPHISLSFLLLLSYMRHQTSVSESHPF